MTKITKEQIAIALIEAKVVHFGEFVGVSGKHLSMYLDHRMLKSFPQQKKIIVQALVQALINIDFKLIADIPHGVTPIVSSLADQLRIPQITPRKEVKAHGVKRTIEGSYLPQQKAVVVDDAATSGLSLEKGIQTLRSELLVNDALVIVNREEGAEKRLQGLDIPVILHSLITLKELLTVGANMNHMNESKLYRNELKKINST
jgi:uridine monophosphate synthetase